MKNKYLRFSAIAFLLLAVIALVFLNVKTGSGNESDSSAQSGSASDKVAGGALSDLAENSSTETPSDGSGSPSPSRSDGSISSTGRTKLRDRDVPDFSAKKLARVDMTPPADEGSPPPPGPSLSADVRTEAKHFLNLRPNNVGVMPRLRVAPGEFLLASLSLPDSSPGDRIHAELSDGGVFPDTKEPGRIYRVAENKSVEITFQASEVRGNCTLLLRQAGHTRTLPLWVGAPIKPPPPIPASTNPQTIFP